jgi:beta-lactamase regulating signal transducer with metallopeptidase domain
MANADMQSLVEIVLSNTAIATLLAVVAMVAGRYVRRPSLVYGLWFLVLLKLVTPPLLRIPVGVFSRETSAVSPTTSVSEAPGQFETRIDEGSDSVDPRSGYASRGETAARTNSESARGNPGPDSFNQLPRQSADSADRAAPFDTTVEPVTSLNDGIAGNILAAHRPSGAIFPWAGLVLGVWAAGTIVAFSIVLTRVLRFRCLVRWPWPTDANLQRQADMLAKRFGLSRSPEVKLVSAALPPMLWGLQRSPVILLPRTLVACLSPEQVLTILAHELAHFRRRDHWVRWFEALILGVYWWHPVAWIARRQLQRAEEECCDAWVLWVLPDAATVYAHTILETVDFLTADYRPSPVLASGLGPVHFLERRFEMILHTRPAHRVGLVAKCALLLLALGVLPLAARGQRADQAAKPAVATEVEASNAASQNQPPGAAGLPTTEPVAQVGQAVPTESTAEISQALPTGSTAQVGQALPARPVAQAAPTTNSPLDPGFTPKQPATAFTPSVSTATAASSISTEDRVARLEKMVQMLVAEMHGQHNNFARPAVGMGSPFGSPKGEGAGSESVSLSDLKKQRIDLEDELETIKERMDKVDAAIAKLQSTRSPQALPTGSLQAK